MFSGSFGSPMSQVVVITVGVAFTGVGVWSAITSERLLKRGKTVNGKITRLAWVSSTTSSGGAYYPEFSFTARDGSTHVVRSHDGSSPCPFSEGQSVVILYDPADPSTAKIDTFGQMWLSALLFGTIGPALLIFDLVYWLISFH
jgi:Protein of unknown function (DUF3592)